MPISEARSKGPARREKPPKWVLVTPSGDELAPVKPQQWDKAHLTPDWPRKQAQWISEGTAGRWTARCTEFESDGEIRRVTEYSYEHGQRIFPGAGSENADPFL